VQFFNSDGYICHHTIYSPSVRSCDVTHSGHSDPKIRADNLLSFAADSSYFQLTQQQTW
jgi:hypothetical protein